MLYKTNTYALARSITYKSIWDAFSMNTPLKELGYTIPDDKTEWRYFMHLNGDVHHLDEELYITSIDTGESVQLTKSNMLIHKKTAVFYSDRANREKLHDSLPLLYTHYIEGVFEPIDYTTAINAEDGTILAYDDSLVESQETTLITRLEEWIKAEHYQYMSEAYAALYPLFVAWFTAKVYSATPGMIETLRLDKIHTVETHSTLIDEFLKSHKYLHRYSLYLTLEQKLFLYRNIRYIERNPGTKDTFEFLVANLLTVRNIPIDGYNLAEKYTGYLDGGLTREAIGYKEPINFTSRDQGRDVETYTIDELIDKELTLGGEHDRLLDDYRDLTKSRIVRTKVVKSPTKLLEVSGVDPESVLSERLIDRLVYEWAYQSATGVYDTNIDLIDPQSGSNMRLTPLQAYNLFVYAYFVGFVGYEPETISNVYAWEQEDGANYTETDYLSYLPNEASPLRTQHINYFLSTHIDTPAKLSSMAEFVDSVTTRWRNKLNRDNYLGAQQTDYDRAEVEQIYNVNYQYRYTKQLYSGDDYKVFLYSLGIDREKYSSSIWQELCYDILKLAIGYDTTDVIGFSLIQKKLCELLVKLTSYTIQIVASSTSGYSLGMEPVGSFPGEVKSSSKLVCSAFIDSGGTNQTALSKNSLEADVIEVFDTEYLYDPGRVYDLGFEVGLEYYSDANINYSVMVGAEPINE